MLKCMFDTNVFNRALDGILHTEALQGKVVVYATHVQRDELNNTRSVERRDKLNQAFVDLVAKSLPTDSLALDASRLDQARLRERREVPTTSAVWGVSRWGEAGWGMEDDLYSALKEDLDLLRKEPNNVQDALIAETAIVQEYTLITDDKNLETVAKKHGGACMSAMKLEEYCS